MGQLSAQIILVRLNYQWFLFNQISTSRPVPQANVAASFCARELFADVSQRHAEIKRRLRGACDRVNRKAQRGGKVAGARNATDSVRRFIQWRQSDKAAFKVL